MAKPEGFGQGFASEAGGRAAKRCSLSLRLPSVVGTLALTVISFAGTPVAARGLDDPTLPTGSSPGDIYTTGPTRVDLDESVRRVASLTVPAGNYVIHVGVRAVNHDVLLTSVLRCFMSGRGRLRDVRSADRPEDDAERYRRRKVRPRHRQQHRDRMFLRRQAHFPGGVCQCDGDSGWHAPSAVAPRDDPGFKLMPLPSPIQTDATTGPDSN